MNSCTVLWSSLVLIATGCGADRITPQAEARPQAEAKPQVEATAQATATCTSTDGTAVVDGLLESLTPVLNKAWPSVAASTGLDPFEARW